ncbi:MAG: hypothetical protein V4673_14490 [Pseudomonadota bacterium]
MLKMQLEHKSHWRADRTCSYCGSMHPDDVFAAIEAGSQLTPTDKSYKVYVDHANPKAGQASVRSSANFAQTAAGWIKVTPENINTLPLDDYQRKHAAESDKAGHEYWVLPGIERERETGKFYFQHFSAEEQQRFIDLLNAKKITLAAPGFFYARPFFIAPPAKATA